MFGLLDLNSCGFERDNRSFYSCNVCNALASKFGRASRLMLTNDSVYLSFLLAGQRDQIPYGTLTRPERCRPWSRDSFCMPEFKYPAAVSVLVAGVDLIDNLHDAPSFQSKVHLAVWRSKIRKAEHELHELGLEFPSLASLVEEQHRREAVVGRELAYYSGTTEEMYSKIFSHTATLAGATGNAARLAEVGRDVGRVAYLLDSYVDFQKDKSEGCFNVFDHLSSSSGSSGIPKLLFAAYVDHSLLRIRENILKVKLRRFQRTIRYTVTEGLWTKVRKTITNPEINALRPLAYSMLPVTIGLAFRVLQSSSDNGDCCDCNGICNSMIPTPTSCIQQTIANTATQTLYGAGAAAVGGASAVAVSAIASHLHAGSATPTEDATPVSVEAEETQSIRTISQSNVDGGPPESPIAATQMPGPLDTDDPIEGLRRTWDYLTGLLRQGSEAGKSTENWAQQQAPPEQPGQGPTFSDSVNRAQDLLNQGRDATSPSSDDSRAEAVQKMLRENPPFGSDGVVNWLQKTGGLDEKNIGQVIDQLKREETAEAGERAMKAVATAASTVTPAARTVVKATADGVPEMGARVVTRAVQPNIVDAYPKRLLQTSKPGQEALKKFRNTHQNADGDPRDPDSQNPQDCSDFLQLFNKHSAQTQGQSQE